MKKIHILLVEDNEGDIFLTLEALEERKIMNKVSIVRNGKDAIDFLLKAGKFENEDRPDIILLDVNLPIKNGHEVLQIIKNNDKLKKIPVIMLTTSSSKKDIDLSYQNYASCFITKPVDGNAFIDAICTMEEFWFQIVSLPSNTTKAS